MKALGKISGNPADIRTGVSQV